MLSHRANRLRLHLESFSFMDSHHSTVNVFAISNSHHQDEQRFIFDARDNSIVADSVLPKIAQLRSLQGFTDASRVVQWGHSFAQAGE
jgi:hypothetical protein